jgi:hypothetical protein
VCNQQKWEHWPSDELFSKGYRFVDTCKENFSLHFEDKDGYWNPVSFAGKYTEEKIRLNSRHKIEIRRMIMDLLSLLGESSIDWDKPSKSRVMVIIKRIHNKYSSNSD